MVGRPGVRVVVAEPTYADDEHAAVNAGLLEAVALGCGPGVLAATARQHAAMQEAADPAAPSWGWQKIAVLPPGGVHLRRMRAQWRVLSALVETHRPNALVLLSAGPETLFVARGLVLRHAGLRLFAVMHGNLATAIGWRSRDPRRRLIDLRAGLRIARHPRIRLVVLEEHIRRAAMRHGLGHDFLVWSTVVLANEAAPVLPWSAPPRLRLAFVGTANRHKGFDDFLALHRNSAAVHDFAVVGRPSVEYHAAELEGIAVPPSRLARADFLAELRRADYGFMAFRGEYELTASGSLLDCINQRKPLIAVRNDMLDGLARRHGPIGYLCDTLDGVQALLADTERLRDAAAYAGFQAALDQIARARLPSALAATIRADLP